MAPRCRARRRRRALPTEHRRRRPPSFVRELGLDGLREVDELVRGLDVAHDRREVARELELALHHALDRVELLPDDLLPARVRRANHEGRLLALLRGDELALPALAVPEVEPGPDRLRDPL